MLLMLGAFVFVIVIFVLLGITLVRASGSRRAALRDVDQESPPRS
jgi:hypothetical protein